MLTPHAGELARLLETDSEEIEARRLRERARGGRGGAQAIVVLKGDDTLVAAPDGRVGGQPRRLARRSRPRAPATSSRA